jgi:hypothetical protein
MKYLFYYEIYRNKNISKENKKKANDIKNIYSLIFIFKIIIIWYDSTTFINIYIIIIQNIFMKILRNSTRNKQNKNRDLVK